MAAVTLSHSQALRVIGQNLTSISTDSFDLITAGDDYVVMTHGSEPTLSFAFRKSFLNQWLERTFRRDNSKGSVPTRMYFRRSDILTSHREQQAKRRINSPTDVRDLSFVLRVVGDYLDKKSTREFAISWSPYSITVRCDGREEIFTLQNIYDLGISMYLKRSNRHSH